METNLIQTNKYQTPLTSELLSSLPDEIVELPKGVNSLYITEDNDTQLKRAIEILK